ncbi:hypothetical protein C8R43DRAFT_951428 [Mycena crocata]|nr:hypothetical protein C8R43DRAFT_951428 [Mycena crocata]
MNHKITHFLNPRSHGKSAAPSCHLDPGIRGKYAPVLGSRNSQQICCHILDPRSHAKSAANSWIQEYVANMPQLLDSRSRGKYAPLVGYKKSQQICSQFLNPGAHQYIVSGSWIQELAAKLPQVLGFKNPGSWIQELAVKLPRVLGFKNSYKGNGQVLESENSTVQTDCHKFILGKISLCEVRWLVVRWLVATSRDERDQRSQQVVKYVNGSREVALGVPEHEKRLLTGRMHLKMYWFFRGKVVAK